MGYTGNKAICILGMHRSGTSAVARAINMLGPYLGPADHLMKPFKGDNPYGFWEHWAIYSLNERLLSHLGSSWDSILPFREEWWKEPGIRPFREELKQLVRSEFTDHPVWMWKDPRTSVLLPFWQDVLLELNIEVSYIICIRNPLDVALSLMRRNNFSKDKSYSLWLLYTISALIWTSGAKRSLLHYDDLIEDWERSLKKVSTSMGIMWPQDDIEFRKLMTGFLQPVERHSFSKAELLFGDKDAFEPVQELYRLLLHALEQDDILDSELFLNEVKRIFLDQVSDKSVAMLPLYNNRAMPQDGVEEEGDVMPSGITSAGAHLLFQEEICRLKFPFFSSPKVSIIIPVWNHWEYTYRCLLAVLKNTCDVAYEVIVVDNGSSDRTEEVLANSENIAVIKNQTNQGFVLGCNQGAASSAGEYLVFLNNDTEPSHGWLKELVDAAESDATVGAVGAKLIYPDGRLQEAGGIIFSDGRGWNFGKGHDPYEEIYSVICEVDYCSGACLLVRKHLFAGLGGFDIRYSPAYYEDTDLCFSLRKEGYKVIYNPHAQVIHHESVTSGTDESSGSRKYLEINRHKFVEKWAEALLHQHLHPSEAGGPPVIASRKKSFKRNVSIENLLWILYHKRPFFGQYAASPETSMPIRYRHFGEKEKKAVDVIITGAGRYGHEKIGIVWAGDENSTALLHLVKYAFDGHIPFKVINILSVRVSPELSRFIERLHLEWGFALQTLCDEWSSGQSSISAAGCEGTSSLSELVPLDRVAELSGARALITGRIWDEKDPATPYAYFSDTEVPGCIIIKPFLHFRKMDVWQYIRRYDVPLRGMDIYRERWG